MTSMAAILSLAKVKRRTRKRRPLGATTTPTFPSTKTGRANLAPRAALIACFGPRCGATRFSGTPGVSGRFVDADGDVGIENGNERVEVGGSKRGDKFVDEFALLREFGAGCRRRALDSAASAAGELPRGFGSAADDFGDFVERRAEQIVKDECEAFSGIEAVENDEECEADGIGQDSFLLGIDLFRDDGWRRRIRRGSGERLFAARVARTKHVETDARDDCGQPAAEIFDRIRRRSG